MCQGKTLTPEHLSSLEIPAGEDVPKTIEELKERKRDLRLKSVEDIEMSFIVEALKRNGWNISRAAADVGMQRTNFHALMKKYSITSRSSHTD